MIFAPDLLSKITGGEKTVTRRKRIDGHPCRYVEGRSYAAQLWRGGFAIERITILTVTAGVVGDVDETEARLEGFASVEAFKERWTELYGNFDAEQPVWRIAFACDPDWPQSSPRRGAGKQTRETTSSDA